MATAPLLLISFQRIYNGERMCFYKYKYILINVYLHIYIYPLCCWAPSVYHLLCLSFFVGVPLTFFPLNSNWKWWLLFDRLSYNSTLSGQLAGGRGLKKKARKQQTKLKDSTVWFSFRNRDECVTTRWYCLLYQMASLLTWMYISVKIKWLKRNCSLRHCLRCEIALF